jgi:DNA polymerase-3 subunit gamma/tau
MNPEPETDDLDPDDEVEAADIRRLAGVFAPDEVQLYYQVALHGRNDMHLAPDEYAGFTMTLLRMLAFAPAPVGEAKPVTPRAAPLVAQPAARTSTPAPRASSPAARPAPDAPNSARAATAAGPAHSSVAVPFDGDWPALVGRLKVAGLVKELANRSALVSHEGDAMKLRVPLKTLLDAGTLDKLKVAVSQALGRPIRLSAEVGTTAGPTAAGIAEQARADRQRQAEEAIYADPFVRELLDNFGASVDPASIRPKDA